MTDTPVPATETKQRPLWLRLWPVYLIIVGLGAAWTFGVFDYLSLETLRTQQATLQAFVEQNFLLAFAAFILLYAAVTAFMVPGAGWVTIAGGLLFGLVGGSIATILGATLGAGILFLAARSSIGESLRKLAGRHAEKVRAEFDDSPMAYMFAMRFVPAVPFAVANIIPAILGAKFRDYVITTALGIVPGVIAYTWIGAGLGATFAAGEDPDFASVAQNLLPAGIALVIVSLIPVAWKKIFAKKSNKIESTT